MVFTNDMANMMPEHGIIMHPLPRNSELPLDVDKNPRAYYFEQAQNGLFVRMAILEELLNPCLSD
jgi:aspartate carbamoyltransferase catalytic subunit